MKTIGEVAQLAGLSVRALRHYDEVGLLEPSERSDGGYRLYDDDDLARLHDVLLWRSLGFPLDEIRALLDDPRQDPMEALMLHRERLVEEVGALQGRIAALDEVIRRRLADESLRDDDLVALFDGFDPAEHEEEAQTRWGNTEAWAQSRRRTARYGAEDWKRLKAEADTLNRDLAERLSQGFAPDAAEVRVLAAAHRAHIDRWFYTCTPEIHLGLGEMYVADPRFAAHYDAVAPGLAQYLRDAIVSLHAERPRSL